MEQIQSLMQGRQIDVEPAGIVISRGREVEQPPRFAAYVWSDVPEPPLDSSVARRAA